MRRSRVELSKVQREPWAAWSGKFDHALAQIQRRFVQLGRIELGHLGVRDEMMARAFVGLVVAE